MQVSDLGASVVAAGLAFFGFTGVWVRQASQAIIVVEGAVSFGRISKGADLLDS